MNSIFLRVLGRAPTGASSRDYPFAGAPLVNTSVKKGSAESYTVRNGYDGATICVVEWPVRHDASGPRYGGVLLAESSFGSYCYTWSACGMPFKRFLIGLNFDYFMDKCRGLDAVQFDGEASFRDVLRSLMQWRRKGSISKAAARDAWDALILQQDEAETNEMEFVRVVGEADLPSLREPWDWIRRSYTPDTRGFWSDIWPLFVAALREELAVPV